MEQQRLTYQETGQFSKLVLDYLEQAPALKSFYHRPPKLESLEAQIQEKSKQFDLQDRTRLVQGLMNQYKSASALSPEIESRINALGNPQTFTVTTGHQLNLFTGPLYFLYKIIGTIKLAEQYQKACPDQTFIPVFWMASEDHDFEEISYFKTKGHKIQWDLNSSGPVGRLSTESLKAVRTDLAKIWDKSERGEFLLSLFDQAYQSGRSLAQATRILVHALFKDDPLLVIDGDDPVLKTGFSAVVHNELSQGLCAQAIKRTTDALVQQGYHKQVHPRHINLFYCQEGLRERLIKDSDGFSVDQTAFKFSQDELLKLVESEPQNFSPNALLRPLYQESILPNLAYLGGSAEVAYWLQLGECFKACQVTFPMVYLRNSVALFPEKAMRKVESLNMTLSNLFLEEQDLSRQCVGSNSNLPIDFGPQKKHLKQQFADLYDLASRTDPSFLGAVAAQEKKQLKGLDRLEQRLMRAEKRKNADLIQRLLKQREYLFPEGTLQERKENMSWGFFELGLDFLAVLKKHIDPSDQRFLTLIFKS